MRALVTGAFGFAGLHLLNHLSESGDEILAASLEGPPAGLKCQTASLDVTSIEQCRKLVREFLPDTIYHLAGMAFAPDADKDFAKALLVNTGGTFNVLKAVAETSSSTRVLVVSSSEVYGQVTDGDLPVTEESPVIPSHSYGLSKATVELVAKRFEKETSVIVARAFNHIGPGQRSDFVVSSFAKQLAEIFLKKTEPVIKVGNLDAKRDFTDVRDIVRGYRLAALKGEGTINLCSGKAVSVQSILDLLIEISGLKVEVTRDPSRMRPSELPILFGSYARAEKTLGWKPSIPLRRSLEDAFNDWVKRLG